MGGVGGGGGGGGGGGWGELNLRQHCNFVIYELLVLCIMCYVLEINDLSFHRI